MTPNTDATAHASARAAVHELLEAHRQLNRIHFRGALCTPQITLDDATSFLGRYHGDTRTIALSRALVSSQPWNIVLEVLKHEMAHQYVHEVLQADEAPHGPAFRNVCARLGIDERASGMPNAEVDPEGKRVLERVHKLLALAESDNRHEAEAAAAAAQRLMLRHNLELPHAAAQTRHGFRQVGRITGRVTEWERRLGNVLREHFFVDVIWVPAFDVQTGRRGSAMEVIGSPENLDLAAYVYDFLARTAERLWAAHKLARDIRGNGDRRIYLAGVMSGFAEKLATQARAHQAEGLVWVPHEELARYTRRRHPYLRTVAHRGSRRDDAFAHGQQAGRDLVLHKGVSSENVRSERKLLRG